MMKDLFRSKIIRTLAATGAVLALPVSAASANSSGPPSASSCTIFVTVQGTSVLGTEVPVLGTQGETMTLPVSCSVVPTIVQNLLDFTVTSEVTVDNANLVYLYVDPRMAD